MMKTSFVVALMLCCAGVSHGQTVEQKDKQFSQDSLKVAPDSTVVFANNDDVTHNLSIRHSDGARLLSATQMPGDRTSVTFAEPGDYRVQCLIHPKMKMTVTVQ